MKIQNIINMMEIRRAHWAFEMAIAIKSGYGNTVQAKKAARMYFALNHGIGKILYLYD